MLWVSTREDRRGWKKLVRVVGKFARAALRSEEPQHIRHLRCCAIPTRLQWHRQHCVVRCSDRFSVGCAFLVDLSVLGNQLSGREEAQPTTTLLVPCCRHALPEKVRLT